MSRNRLDQREHSLASQLHAPSGSISAIGIGKVSLGGEAENRVRRTFLVLFTIAGTIAVVGLLLVLYGFSLVNDSNAKVQRSNALGCGGANCTTLAPGSDQPEGMEGMAFELAGTYVGIAGVLVGAAAVAGQLAGRRRSPRA
jgi:hypothetical protein